MRRLAGLAVLVACGATSARPRAVSAPPPSTFAVTVAGDDHPTPATACFGYAPARRAYACLGYVLDDDAGEPRTGWVDLLGAGLAESHLVWRSAGPQPGPAAVERRLATLGFAAAPLSTTELPPATWVRIDGAGLRYQLHLHEGDASFEYLGSLDVRCPDGAVQPVELRALGLELGAHAVASWAPGTRTLAVSVHGIDGGEGRELHVVNTVVLDVGRLCAGQPGIHGPIPGRSIGP